MPLPHLLLPLFLAGSSIAPAVPQTSSDVVIDVQKVAAQVTEKSLGLGVAVWDEHMMDASIPKQIRDLGVRIIRYPGGSYGDLYHWKTHRATDGMDSSIKIVPGTDFDSFMKLAKKAGTTPLITVNYGSNPQGTDGAEPSEAADWVRYANKTKRYGVKYWEIGNEVYGNGFYNGNPWEEDRRVPMKGKPGERLQNPKLGPTTYGTNVAAFATAMKKVDPSIKVGAILTCPGGWPYGVAPRWNENVLKACGDKIDFVVIHWYGEGKTPLDTLNCLKKVPAICSTLRKEIETFCGPRSESTEIWMTEGDASGYGMKHEGALFAADHLLTWWESGADHVDWWNLHNGLWVGDDHYDDQGILSSGHLNKGIQQPPANTPFPPYFGIQLVNKLVQPGDALLSTTGTTDKVSIHAIRKRNGSLALLVVNKDPNTIATVRFKVVGMGVKGSGTRYNYGQGDKAITISKWTGSGDTIELTVPAYSLCGLVAAPAGRKR